MLQDFYQVVRRKSLYELSQTQPYLRHFPRIDENQTVYNSVFKNRKRNLTAVIFHFVVAVQEHNRRVQLRTYALPNQFQKRLNYPFSIDQEMIFAKI